MIEKFSIIYALINKGGLVLWVLLGCSLCLVSLITNRLIFWVSFWNKYPKYLMSSLTQVIDIKKLNENSKAFKRCFGVSIEALTLTPYAKLLIQAELLEAQILARCLKGQGALSLMVTIAPLLGILGTVLGIIRSFKVLGNQSVQDPSLISAGIAEALLTTVCGLIIAVISYVAFSFFEGLSKQVQFQFSQLVSRIQLIRKGAENEVES